MGKELMAWGWSRDYRRLCPFLAWESPKSAGQLDRELRAPATRLCLAPASFRLIRNLAEEGLLAPLDGVFTDAELARYVPDICAPSAGTGFRPVT